MDRTDGLLFGGVALVAGALRRMEDDAVDMTRRDINMRVRRHVLHSRRRARDSASAVQLVIGAAILFHGLRMALREWSAVDDAEAVPVGLDIEPGA